MAHLSETHSRAGVLSRNSTYRDDCRSRMRSILIYDNEINILAGIQNRDAQTRQPTLVKGLTQIQRVPLYKLDHTHESGRQNFRTGYLPYSNQAHHILPIEAFYEKKWTARHLAIVMASGYNINRKSNLIYLPQCYGRLHLMRFHFLPDHSKGHSAYNIRVIKKLDAVHRLVDEALEEPNCQKGKDIRDQILKALDGIETKEYTDILQSGPGNLK